jgi:hypothetical protein
LNQAKDVIDNLIKVDKPPISERYFDKRSIIKPESKQVVRVCGIAKSNNVEPKYFQKL